MLSVRPEGGVWSISNLFLSFTFKTSLKILGVFAKLSDNRLQDFYLFLMENKASNAKNILS